MKKQKIIEEFFKNSGPLSEGVINFHEREDQVEMAKIVNEAIEEKNSLIVFTPCKFEAFATFSEGSIPKWLKFAFEKFFKRMPSLLPSSIKKGSLVRYGE